MQQQLGLQQQRLNNALEQKQHAVESLEAANMQLAHADKEIIESRAMVAAFKFSIEKANEQIEAVKNENNKDDGEEVGNNQDV